LSKAHKVQRLLSERIYNQPLLITPDGLCSVLDYLEHRTTSVTAQEIEASLIEQGINRSEKMLTDDLALIPITGSLSYQSTFLSSLCGLTSYESLVSDVQEALSMGIKNIIFRADSSGGEAFAMMSSADMIRKMADEAGAKIYTYIDGMAASACYGLIVISDEIIAHPDSQAGSVGVVIQLMNNSEKLKQEGYKRKFITSAESKVPFDEDGEFKPDFIAGLKESVDKLHGKFVAHVAKYRPMTEQDVNGLQAKVFDSEKAMSLGLIDKIMDHSQFQEYMETLGTPQEEKSSPMITNIFKPKAKASAEAITTEEDDAMKLAELQAQYEDVAAKLSASVDQVTSLESQVLEALASVDEKDAELNAALSELNAIKQANLEATNASKLTKLAAVYGDEQAQEMFEALSALPEAAFDKIVSAKRLDNETVTKSPMFTEMGVTGDAETKEPLTQEEVLIARIKKQQVK